MNETKTYVSWDRHDLGKSILWMIKRPDPYAPRLMNELPLIGESVRIDGELVQVERAEFSGDSEFKWYPHIVIFSPKQQ